MFISSFQSPWVLQYLRNIYIYMISTCFFHFIEGFASFVFHCFFQQDIPHFEPRIGLATPSVTEAMLRKARSREAQSHDETYQHLEYMKKHDYIMITLWLHGDYIVITLWLFESFMFAFPHILMNFSVFLCSFYLIKSPRSCIDNKNWVWQLDIVKCSLCRVGCRGASSHG